jgi:hypothetical protein
MLNSVLSFCHEEAAEGANERAVGVDLPAVGPAQMSAAKRIPIALPCLVVFSNDSHR